MDYFDTNPRVSTKLGHEIDLVPSLGGKASRHTNCLGGEIRTGGNRSASYQLKCACSDVALKGNVTELCDF